MPKKRKHSLQYKPQSSVHPSLQHAGRQHVNNQGTAQAEQQPAQVNDLLRHLRQTQARHEPVQESGSVYPASVPTMNVPMRFPATQQQPATVLTPRERWNARVRRRRVPGPPAPPSWTQKTTARMSHRQLEADASEHAKRMDRLPDLALPPTGSLQYMCVRKMAVEWSAYANGGDGRFLSFIPQHLKQALLAFLCVYGPELVPTPELELLFLDLVEMDEGGSIEGSGCGQITHAHLGFAPNPATVARGYKDLVKMLSGSEWLAAHPASKAATGESQSGPTDVPESWDADEILVKDNVPASLAAPRFASLTHLSLAHAPHASWKYLLRDLTPNMKQLTHLSLAYWPQPCLTPNARTASFLGPTGAIGLSATPWYNALDGDWEEAVSVMEHLGKDLVRLKWLDLEGCSLEGGWIDALIYESSKAGKMRSISWTNTFRGLETLIISQGETPEPLSKYATKDALVNQWAIPAYDLWTYREGILGGRPSNNKVTDITSRDLRDLLSWLGRENRIYHVSEEIGRARRRHGISAELSVQGTPHPPYAKAMVKAVRYETAKYALPIPAALSAMGLMP